MLPPYLTDWMTDWPPGTQVIGIYICRDLNGRATSECFVEFEDVGLAHQAMGRNGELMGGSQIELFACSKEEVVHHIKQARQASSGNVNHQALHQAASRQQQMAQQQVHIMSYHVY